MDSNTYRVTQKIRLLFEHSVFKNSRSISMTFWHPQKIHVNKCIGDDTKAATRQILNCIKNKRIKYGEKRFSIMANGFLTLCNVAWRSGIVTVNSPSGSTLPGSNVIRGSGMTCHWIRPNVRHWNSTSGFDFDHITAVDMSFCTSLQNFIQIGPTTVGRLWCNF